MSKNKEIYLSQYSSLKNLPVFFCPWYLDATCGADNWDVALSRTTDGNIKGVLPYFTKAKYGISHITMPMLTPYLGPYFFYPSDSLKNTSKYHFEKKTSKELIDQLPEASLIKMHCLPSLFNGLAIIWEGFRANQRYTFCLNRAPEATLLENLDSKQRNIINTAKSRITIRESQDAQEFYALNEKSFSRTNVTIPYTSEFFLTLDKVIVANGKRKIIIAEDEDQNIHSAIYLLYGQNTAYCLAMGSDPDYKNSGAISVLMWNAILSAFKDIEVFNFEGGMIPNIEQFFRSFGGELTPYLYLQKSKNIFWQSIFTLAKKI